MKPDPIAELRELLARQAQRAETIVAAADEVLRRWVDAILGDDHAEGSR